MSLDPARNESIQEEEIVLSGLEQRVKLASRGHQRYLVGRPYLIVSEAAVRSQIRCPGPRGISARRIRPLVSVWRSSGDRLLECSCCWIKVAYNHCTTSKHQAICISGVVAGPDCLIESIFVEWELNRAGASHSSIPRQPSLRCDGSNLHEVFTRLLSGQIVNMSTRSAEMC